MDAVTSSDAFLFDQFLFDRRGGGLFHRTEVSLGSRALAVLGVLIERHGDLVSKDAIMSAVWPGPVVEESNLSRWAQPDAASRRTRLHAGLLVSRRAGGMGSCPGKGWIDIWPLS
jgi:hypothetical protein